MAETKKDALAAFDVFVETNTTRRSSVSSRIAMRYWPSTTSRPSEAAEKSWRRLDGPNQLPRVILGAKFFDEIEVVRS